MRTIRPALAFVLVAAIAGGCTSVKMTGTARTGTEQLLLTGAWDAALGEVNFLPLAGSKAFVDPQYVAVVDKEWVLSSIRRAMAEQGVLLQDKKEQADVVVEAALAAYGTDERNCSSGLGQGCVLPAFFGLPAGANSGSGSPSALTPSSSNKQDAVVKAALFAYDAKSGRMVWESGPLLNAEGVRDHFFLGSGPYRISSLPEVDEYPDQAQKRSRQGLIRRIFGRR